MRKQRKTLLFDANTGVRTLPHQTNNQTCKSANHHSDQINARDAPRLRLIKVDPPPAFSCVLFECACHIYGASSCSMRGDRRSRSTNQRVDEFLSVDEREICSLTELRGHGVRSILCESTQSAAPWSVCGCLTRALLRRILLPQSRRIARDCTSTSHRRCSEQTQLAFVTRFLPQSLLLRAA